MNRRALLLIACVLAAGCGQRGEIATYRLAGNLVPDFPEPCGECAIALVLDGVRSDDGSSSRGRFMPTIGEEVGFRFRWGVEQVVEVETEEVFVPNGVVDDHGVRKRIVKVLEVNPLPSGAPFEMYFRQAAPGNYGFNLERDATGLRMGDLQIQCLDAGLCDSVAALALGERGFTLELSHAVTEGGPLTLHALRLDP